MRKVLVLAICLAALSAAACNTVEGVGKDAAVAGNAVAKAAKDAK